MHKYIKNEMVAVVVSHDYGAGWSTWAGDPIEQQQLLFDPAIIDYILSNQYSELEQYVKLKYPDRDYYDVTKLSVRWIKQGTEFIIQEYDGLEDIYEKNKLKWITA